MKDNKVSAAQQEKYNIYWSDLHNNPHTCHLDALEENFNHAKSFLDFWPIAYYPYDVTKLDSGFTIECFIDREQIKKDWETIREFVIRKQNQDSYPVFMGWEWQGDGNYGDHNVFYLDNDQPIHNCLKFPELMKKLPRGRAIAIPHHPGYVVGFRGKNWDYHDEVLSPFVEIYSCHGSSEQDITDDSVYCPVMGPIASGGTVFDGLAKGHKFGIIASGDNHPCPGVYGKGLMACYAKDSSREALWDAMLKRRVYGVTGDRIKLAYTLNGAMMGGSVNSGPPFVNEVEVEGGSCIDRIELYRNNLLISTYTHTGKWETLPLKDKVRFKFKTEFGWGPSDLIYKDTGNKVWQGSLQVDGRIVSIEKCWKNTGQSVEQQGDKTCRFSLTTRPVGKRPLETQGFIFEVEAPVDSSVTLMIDGKEFVYKVRDILERSQVVAFLDESRTLAYDTWKFEGTYREGPFWAHAYKFKIYQGIPESGYKVRFTHQEDTLKRDEDYYMVKVIQKDGQRAWSSPIWVR